MDRIPGILTSSKMFVVLAPSQKIKNKVRKIKRPPITTRYFSLSVFNTKCLAYMVTIIYTIIS